MRNPHFVLISPLPWAFVGSGIIYAILVVLWIAYFVPAWLRRHDEASESRSVERYRSAMRVVSRGTEAEIAVTVAERIEARAAMLRRRQKLFFGIAGLLLLTLGLAMFGLIAPWLITLPLFAGGLYIVYVRKAKVQEELVARRRLLRASHNLDVTVRPSALSLAKAVQETAFEPQSTLASSTVHVIERDESGWHPVDVPVPTYVTAPRAVRAHRVIDLTKPGAWSQAQQAEEAARLAAIAPSRDQVFDQVAADAAASEIAANQAAARAANE